MEADKWQLTADAEIQNSKPKTHETRSPVSYVLSLCGLWSVVCCLLLLL